VIKIRFIILFLLSTVLYTEGVFAQGSFDKKDYQPIIPEDSLEISDLNDTSEYAPISPISPKKRSNPYEAAEKKYLAEPIETAKVSPSNWEKAKAGIDYSSDKLNKPKEDNTSFNANWMVVFELLKWFFIIGAVVLLAYLILRFVGEGNIFGTKKRRISDPSVEIDLTEIEENLDTADLDPLIRKAIADGNYTLAVRLYYLAILKELHLKGDIDWKKDKTNRIYLREMRENRFFEPFRNTTSVFERVWYGNQTIDENKFEVIQPDFQSLLKSLR
jgi:hypothetical protein